MFERVILRRIVTISAVVLMFVVTTVLAPLLLILAVLVDIARALAGTRAWMTTRSLVFGWAYLLGEMWAVMTLGLVALTGKQRSIELTYGLQRTWARWNLLCLEFIFGLSIAAKGLESAESPPFIVLSRHASLIDTLIPAELITRPSGVRLRYVLKKELLLDPALDIAGNRLPNYFVARGSGESESDRQGIKDLIDSMGSDEAVLIYPEGTRFSVEKQRRLRARFAEREGRVAELAVGLERVLPPRPGGTLALLEASEADVVILAHNGLEGFARVKDIWAGDLVGRTINVKMTRIARGDIPEDRGDRVQWLFEVWSDLDKWVQEQADPGHGSR